MHKPHLVSIYPAGTCTITLTATDLGNFVVHDILKDPTSTVSLATLTSGLSNLAYPQPSLANGLIRARLISSHSEDMPTTRKVEPCAHPTTALQAVDGQAFLFDKTSVRFWVDPLTKEGSVYLEGEWAGDDSRYSVKMTPSNGVSLKV